jgi:hypothetical protein
MDVVRVTMAYRDHGVTSIKVGIYIAVLIPESCIQSLDRFNVPELIYFE